MLNLGLQILTKTYKLLKIELVFADIKNISDWRKGKQWDTI